MSGVEGVLREHSYLHVRRCKCGARIDDFRAHLADAIRTWLTERLRDAGTREAVAEALYRRNNPDSERLNRENPGRVDAWEGWLQREADSRYHKDADRALDAVAATFREDES